MFGFLCKVYQTKIYKIKFLDFIIEYIYDICNKINFNPNFETICHFNCLKILSFRVSHLSVMIISAHPWTSRSIKDNRIPGIVLSFFYLLKMTEDRKDRYIIKKTSNI